MADIKGSNKEVVNALNILRRGITNRGYTIVDLPENSKDLPFAYIDEVNENVSKVTSRHTFRADSKTLAVTVQLFRPSGYYGTLVGDADYLDQYLQQYIIHDANKVFRTDSNGVLQAVITFTFKE